MFPTNFDENESLLESNKIGSISTDLDGVSTTYNDTQSFLDSDFRQTLEPYFITPSASDHCDSTILPITAKKKAIINQIKLNRTLIIVGATGCGKTTQVPQFIMDDCFSRGQNFNVIFTQPRRIAAVSIAKRVCHERGWSLGEIVGSQIGMEKVAHESLTRLLYYWRFS